MIPALHMPFLAAITARPDDDLPRLVFADYLEETGHEARAEFIRLHCERWQTQEKKKAAQPMGDRIAGLRAANEAAWRAELPNLPGVVWGRYWRGFVAEARFADPAALVSQATAAFAATPVQFVRVGGLSPEWAEAVCGLPQMDGLYGLRLDDVSFDLALWRALTGCGWFARLRHLIARPQDVELGWDHANAGRNEEVARLVLAAAARGNWRLGIVHLAMSVFNEDSLRWQARGRVRLAGFVDCPYEPL